MRLSLVKTAAVLEGLLLTGFGLFMLTFAFSQEYWMLLNPKFSWLTATGGGVLALCGLARATEAQRPAGTGRIVMLVLVLAMGLGLVHLMAQQDDPPGRLIGESRASTPAPPRLTWDGREYIKINIGELYIMAEQGVPARLEQPYVLRGQVSTNPALAQLGLFALLRTSMTCCLADAVSVGFLVSYPGHQPPRPGSWVMVYGRPQPLGGQKFSRQNLGQTGIMFTAINQKYFLVADNLQAIAPPAVPFMFEFRSGEPYAY